MKTALPSIFIATMLLIAATGFSHPVQAQSEASQLSAISALPLASVVIGGSAVAGAALALPVALSTAGGVLIVKTVDSTARATVLVLERASDSARVSVEVIGTGVAAASLMTGTVVAVSVIGAGIVLSAAGEMIAFLPNALGSALLHNERLTR